MTHSFAERFDFVMDVTHTTNSSLARALSFDASYICRIRKGKRGLPRSQPFVEPAASYLASRVSNARQQHALEEEIGRAWPANRQEAANLLATWLLAEARSAPAVGHAIAALSTKVADETSPASGGTRGTVPSRDASPYPCVSFYYGNEGKREAVRAFLSQLPTEGKPCELWLHSDEDMSWLYEDASFAREWTVLLLHAIDNGCRVRIVHTISRDANEMWEAVGAWMPLYMTGAVEPYYYPRLRDGVYRRTLFVACGHSAIVASSVGDATTDGLNMLVVDSDAVAAYEREFSSFLALCRPLMDVVFPQDMHHLAKTLAAFSKGRGGLLAMIEDGKLACAWEEGPALVANLDSPLVVFGIEERLMSAAVWGYLQSLPTHSVRRDADAVALLDCLVQGGCEGSRLPQRHELHLFHQGTHDRGAEPEGLSPACKREPAQGHSNVTNAHSQRRQEIE